MATLTGVAAITDETNAYVQRKGDGKACRRGRSLKDGGERLRKASDKALAEITDDMVSQLKGMAQGGDVVCMKTLVTFSDRKPLEKRKKRQRGLTPAQKLGLAPQWEDGKPWGPGCLGPGAPFGAYEPV